MDITRGSLDEISRPSSNSRINHRNKVLSASLEILTPERDIHKVDCSLALYKNFMEDYSKENDDESGEEYEIKKMNTEEISEGKMSSDIQLLIHNTSQVKVYISNSADSEDDCAENKLSSCSNVPQDKQAAEIPTEKLEDSKESNVDRLIQQAIKKMKRLDQILANKQSQEKAVKKQGKELRTKLWEELQSMTSRSSPVSAEEVENTSRFLALTSEPSSPAAMEEDEMLLFHTQISPENYELSGRPVKQGFLNAERKRSPLKKTENMHQKMETSSEKPCDFIKKNIELVKEYGNPVILLEEEKKRLSELLKDTEDESSELQVLEGETTGWLVPGEGYTPEPMEYHYLTELDAKLEIIISDEDFSAIQSSPSKVPKQIYQESLAYANRKLETVPGEKVLRDTKEERDQQNRLKEIDEQLKNLEKTPDALPSVSKEQLNALLEEYMQSQRTVNRLALPTSEESLLDGMRPHFDQPENSSQDPGNNLLDDDHCVEMLRRQEEVAAKDGGVCSKEMMENAEGNDVKVLAESHLSEEPMTEKKENDNQKVQQEMLCTNNSAGYVMSALTTDKLKRPSFLDEPFYCTSMNNELSTDVDIPRIPLKTRGDKLQDENADEEKYVVNLSSIDKSRSLDS